MPNEPRPWVLAESTWRTVGATPYEVAVLPWGATEAHNYHLPYATDVVEASEVAAEAARLAWEAGAKTIVLPTVPFGVQTGQLDIPLCINLNPSTQAAILGDVARTLAVLRERGHAGVEVGRVVAGGTRQVRLL